MNIQYGVDDLVLFQTMASASPLSLFLCTFGTASQWFITIVLIETHYLPALRIITQKQTLLRIFVMDV